MTVQTVIFDLDGTLFDHEGAARTGVSVWLRALGLAASDQAVSLWFDAEERYIAEWHRGELDWSGQRRARIRHVLEHLGRDGGDEAAVDAGFAIYLEAYEKAWRPFEDVMPALRWLADEGIGVAVLTNGADYQQRAKLAACGLTRHAGRLFSSDAIGFAKPDPRAYQCVCEELKVDPSQVLHIGDRHDLDVIAAREAGLMAAHLDRDNHHREDEPTRMRSLRELPDILRYSNTSG